MNENYKEPMNVTFDKNGSSNSNNNYQTFIEMIAKNVCD